MKLCCLSESLFEGKEDLNFQYFCYILETILIMFGRCSLYHGSLNKKIKSKLTTFEIRQCIDLLDVGKI